MTLIEQIHKISQLAPQSAGLRRDSITLNWEERRQGHGRRHTDGGVEFAISLPSGAILKEGDCFVLEPEQMVVALHEAKEPVYVVHPQKAQDWAYYAYHVGNRHQAVMIGERELIFLQNPAVQSLLDQLHAEYNSDVRAFNAALIGHQH